MVNLNLKFRGYNHILVKKNKAKKVNTNTLQINRGYNSLNTINESGSRTMCTQATNRYINNDGHTKSKQKGLTSKRSFEKMPFPSKSPFPSASLPTWLSSVHCWPEKDILLLFQTMFNAESCGRKLPISHKKCLRISYFFRSNMLNKSLWDHCIWKQNRGPNCKRFFHKRTFLTLFFNKLTFFQYKI